MKEQRVYLVSLDLTKNIVLLDLITDLFLPPHIALGDTFGKWRNNDLPDLP